WRGASAAISGHLDVGRTLSGRAASRRKKVARHRVEPLMAVSARKVLVVDDDADWREFVSVSLSELGYQPLEAQDGEAALAVVEAERPAVMLLDLHMPGMNGEQVVARLPKDGGRRVV